VLSNGNDRQALLGNGSNGREAEARLEARDEHGLLVDARAVALHLLPVIFFVQGLGFGV